MIDDGELLRRYAHENSEPAFSELVHRHLNVVLAAAVRQTRDAHAARDVVQIVFASLARQAGSLCGRPILLSWLFTAVHYTASKARRAETRRQLREQEALVMQEIDSGDADWNRLRPELDAAMNELDQADREALLLRYFQGLSFVEMTQPLRVSEDGARKRVGRALEKLRGPLARRGIASTAAALAATLSAHPPPDALPGLGDEIVSQALGSAKAGGAGAAGVLAAWQKVLGVAVLTAAAVAVYLSGVARRQTTALAAVYAQLRSAEAGAQRAGTEFAALSAQLDAVRQQIAAAGRAGPASPARAANAPWPSNPDAQTVELLVSAAQAGANGTPATPFRTAPLHPAAVSVLPTAELFEITHFLEPGTPASWAELARAGIGLKERTADLREFMESHGVFAGLVDRLAETSVLLQKDAGTNPEVAGRLRSTYAETAAGMTGLARMIAERSDERAEAVELIRQLAALGGVITRRLPPEYQPPAGGP